MRWSLLLFVLGVAPLLCTSELPLQDVPNHLASMTVLANPAEYPELVATGFLKTNSLLFLFLKVCHGFGFSWIASAKLFAALTIALNAVVFPRVLDAFGGRRALTACGWFLLPLVHNWWVLMGMLDYAVAIPMACECMLLAHACVARITPSRCVRLALLGLLVWYAHVFAVLIFGVLAIFELVRLGLRRRRKNLVFASLALAPMFGLAVMSLASHLAETSAPLPVNYPPFLPIQENLYNLWAECIAGLTSKSAMSLLAFVPFVVGVVRARRRVPWFSRWALAFLALVAIGGPYILTAWFYVNDRVVPFLWLALFARASVALPTWFRRVAAVSALGFSATLCWDYVRLGEDQAAIRAAIPSLPENARLLPIVLDAKGRGEHTRPLLQSWGYYVVEKRASAPLLFAHSKSFPLVYRDAPSKGLNHLELEQSASTLRSKERACANEPPGSACDEELRGMWTEVWTQTAASFDWVLLVKPTARARASVPAAFDVRFDDGNVALVRRRDARPQ